jgi:hypothetical protein
MSHPYKGHSQNAVGKRRANKLVHGNEYARGGWAEGGRIDRDKGISLLKSVMPTAMRQGYDKEQAFDAWDTYRRVPTGSR